MTLSKYKGLEIEILKEIRLGQAQFSKNGCDNYGKDYDKNTIQK